MALRSLLLAALGVMPLVTGHPTGKLYLVYLLACFRLLMDIRIVGKQNFRRETNETSEDIIVYDASVAKPTRVAQVVVWVDKAGEAVSTATESVLLLPTSLALGYVGNESTTTTTMTAYSTKTLVVAAPSTSTGAAGDLTPIRVNPSAAVARRGDADPALPSETGKPANISELFGVSYTAYRADQQCKSQEDIDNDFQKMAGIFSIVRIYGTDCDQIPKVYKAAKANGMKMFLGIWSPAAVKDEASKIISGINGDWAIVDTVSVGNELVNNGQESPRSILEAVDEARSALRAAGFQGPVVTVDTFNAAIAHPELCDESDRCTINAHAFFDSTIAAEQAGTWLRNTVSQVRDAISTPKKIVVAETGWPMRGKANGMAIPSLENQKLALESIKKEFASTPGDVILFSAFNDLWKQKNAATFDADQYWGIDGAVSSCDA